MHPAELSTATAAGGASAINWTRWSSAAFARAEREQKLVFLWIAARWAAASRAMEADALADPVVIDLINHGFVAVKVESDERPDINERYNLGGWPTTAILTDDGEVLTGGTSFTRDALLGVLGRSLEALTVRGEAIRAKAKEMAQARHDRLTGHVDLPAEPDRAAVSWMRQHALDELDQEYGGFVIGPAKAGHHEERSARAGHHEERSARAGHYEERSARAGHHEERSARAGHHVIGPAKAGHHEERSAKAGHEERSATVGHRDERGATVGLHDCPKFPHVPVLRFLLRLCGASSDPDAADALTMSLDAMGDSGLRDPQDGGFFRYTEARDWSAPCPDKTLEDNAALLGVYADAAAMFGRRDYLEVARDTLLVVRQKLGDVMYATDAASDAVRACLAAAELLGETSIRDFALASLDRVMLKVYRPAHGVAHWYAESPDVWGLLADQARASEAALVAHQVTGSPVYSMLAEELMRYALRVMWDEAAGAFVDRAEGDVPDVCGRLRDPQRPLGPNCEAASLLLRLARLTGDRELDARANRILRCFAGSYRAEGLLGAPYALAMLEVDHPNPEFADPKLGPSP